MTLVKTDWPSFEAYLAALSVPAWKNHRACEKKYGHLKFAEASGSFPLEIKDFMELWEKQLVRGFHPHWAFPIGTVERWWELGQLKVFAAFDGINKVAMHFIQQRDGYWECHPPMYDKKHSDLGTWMWFQLIKWAIEHKLEPLDLGGGIDTSWRMRIKLRDTHPNSAYKWRFVPQVSKKDPDAEPDFYIQDHALRISKTN